MVPFVPGREAPTCIYSSGKHNIIRALCVDNDYWNPTAHVTLVINKVFTSPNRIKQIVPSKCGKFILVLREIRGMSTDSSMGEKEIFVELYSIRLLSKRRTEW
eukprot:gnl/Chilomastix_caulleri/2414.p1 GENE.gnl/Chilomastix_caulleri/2414~~gnl/Chilomastix_caulleri/2414.p1  ORF type:complete len:103 (+),score=20.61 gnl/Chilomastix_caulleri/2414:171-479(+)